MMVMVVTGVKDPKFKPPNTESWTVFIFAPLLPPSLKCHSFHVLAHSAPSAVALYM